MDFMKVIAVAVVVALVMFTVINTLKTTTYRKMVSLLENGSFEEFHSKIDSRFMKTLFPKSAILDLKLNAALVEQKKKEATAILEQICAMPLTTPQKENYYMKAFNFYVGLEDARNSKKYLSLINELPNERMKFEANRVYNIFILKNDKDLKDLLEKVENMEDREKGVNEYLISVIYKNKKDRENQKKYAELSRQHFALVDADTAEKIEKEQKK